MTLSRISLCVGVLLSFAASSFADQAPRKVEKPHPVTICWGGPVRPRTESKRALSPVEAAKAEGTEKMVTVEFVVESTHPDGNEFRLSSSVCPFRLTNSFVVVFPAEGAKEMLGVEDLEKHFAGKRIRVTGKVEKVALGGVRFMRPGILVNDPREIKFITPKRQRTPLVHGTWF